MPTKTKPKPKPKPKGHWPAGKRRKPPTGVDVRADLRRAVARAGLRAVGRLLGVDQRTVGRWMRGERFPDAAEVARIKGLE